MSPTLAPAADPPAEPRPFAFRPATAAPRRVRTAAADAPDVTVCIANWNCREYLRRCLDSILEFPQGTVVEVIVVDNASTDGAAEMVAEEFPDAVLIRNADNVGFARASNQAARLANGRYVFFLNNDTVVPPLAIGRLVAFADGHPNVGMIGPRLRDGDGKLQISYRRKPTLRAMLHRAALLRWTGLFRRAYDEYRRDGFDPAGVRRVEVLMGAAVLMPRAIYDQCGGWDEGFRFGVEDVELSDRVGRVRPIVHVPGVEVTHYGRVSSRQNVTFAAPNLMIGYVRYFRKSGTARLPLLIYKLVFTIDAPVQLLGKAVQYALRRLTGADAEKAEKSRLALCGGWRFLTRELVRFWQA
jgi:N-acetylglucosaminyl-diphospho-decaprenol L-rhamnosyltransferase